MKKILALLLALLLTAAVTAGSGEEETAAPGMFDLYAMDGETPVWLGTAVSLYDGILMTADIVLPESLTHLVITDGRNVWDAEAAAPDRAGIAVTILYDTETQKPAAGIFELDSGAAKLTDCFVTTGDEKLSRVNRDVLSGSAITWRSASCLLLSLSGSVAPGSPLVTEDGKLAGIAVGEWAEGENRVVFLSADGVYQSLSEALDMFTGENPVDPPEGLEITLKANTVTFDWSRMNLPEKAEGEELYLIVADSINRYLTYYRIDDAETSCDMLLTPGRTYHSGIAASAETPSQVPDSYAVTVLPPAEKLTDYGFTSVVCAIAEAPEEGLPENGLPTPVTEVTEELLRSGRAYFYSFSTYEVPDTIEGISLLITLTDPEGNNYRYASGWIYDPSYMDNDVWAVSMNDTGLLEMLNDFGYPAGTYEMTMYIGGALADSFTFELK